MTITLEVTKRAKGERPTGKVVGVVYGPKQEPIPLAMDRLAFEKTLRQAGESTIINLAGLNGEIEVLVQDVTFDAARGGVDHVDFYAIERGKELTTNVALNFVGEAPVEKIGATINKVLHDVVVTCRPSKLPSHIDVDLSTLESEESQIRIADLTAPEDVKIDNDPEETVVSVSGVRQEEPEEPAEGVDMAAVEVEAKGKDAPVGENEQG